LPSDDTLDLIAASRIARRVDLREIRLTECAATLHSDGARLARLVPTYEHECTPAKVEADVIEVNCSYQFKVTSDDADLAEARLTYRIVYAVLGDAPVDPADIAQFAKANGAYHSWPFVRETIFGLTSKMGFPPYTLPVLVYKPKPPAQQASATGQKPE
jgi:hypothetical protein